MRWVANKNSKNLSQHSTTAQKCSQKLELSAAVTYMFGDVAAPGVHIVPVSTQERVTANQR